MSIPAAGLRRFYITLRVISYVCGIVGMIMYLAARGMEEPGRTVWGQRAFIALIIMFCGFISCYVVGFMANAMRKK